MPQVVSAHGREITFTIGDRVDSEIVVRLLNDAVADPGSKFWSEMRLFTDVRAATAVPRYVFR